MHTKYVRNVWIKDKGGERERGRGLKRTTRIRLRQERQAKNGRNMRTCGQNVCMFLPNKLNEFKERSSNDSHRLPPPYPWQVINPKGMRRKKPKENTSEIKTQNCKMPQEQQEQQTSATKKREQMVFAFGIGMSKAATTTGNNNRSSNGGKKTEKERREMEQRVREREGDATVAVAGIIIKSTNRF